MNRIGTFCTMLPTDPEALRTAFGCMWTAANEARKLRDKGLSPHAITAVLALSIVAVGRDWPDRSRP